MGWFTNVCKYCGKKFDTLEELDKSKNSERAINILKKRYTDGEITANEFKERKEALKEDVEPNNKEKSLIRRNLIFTIILFSIIVLFILGIGSYSYTILTGEEPSPAEVYSQVKTEFEKQDSDTESYTKKERSIEYEIGDTIKKGNYEVTLQKVSKNYIDLFESYNLCSDIFYSDCKSKGKESPYSKKEIEDIDRLRTKYVQHFSPDILKEIYNKYGSRATKFLYIKHKHKVIDSSKLPDSAFEPFGIGYDRYTKEFGVIYETSDVKIFDTKTERIYNNVPQNVFNSNLGEYLFYITEEDSEYNPYQIPISKINNELKIIIIYSPCDIDFSEEERKITLQDIKDIEEGKKCDGIYIFTINPSELSNEVKLG